MPMNRQTTLSTGTAVALLLGLMLALARPCAAAQTADTAQLKQKTEQLYLNYKLLDGHYKDVREVASAYMYQSDQQLNYIQKI